MRYILYSIPYLDWALNNRLDCRTHLATKVTMTGGWVIQAEDDGGLRLRRGIASGGDDGLHVYHIRSRLADCYYVMFEAKKAFQINDGQPTISDNWLSQMTAEALVGRLARSSFNSESHALNLYKKSFYINCYCPEIFHKIILYESNGSPRIIHAITTRLTISTHLMTIGYPCPLARFGTDSIIPADLEKVKERKNGVYMSPRRRSSFSPSLPLKTPIRGHQLSYSACFKNFLSHHYFIHALAVSCIPHFLDHVPVNNCTWDRSDEAEDCTSRGGRS
ncbi:hypothetical protein F5X98DRAFT_163798 [Xylaria grammica]|nr:hypothetical protein F5X98DRAFT_163798 [Xylaria grammica]